MIDITEFTRAVNVLPFRLLKKQFRLTLCLGRLFLLRPLQICVGYGKTYKAGRHYNTDRYVLIKKHIQLQAAVVRRIDTQ